MKSELAALDRKIQLELAPKHEETLNKDKEQGIGQTLSKVEKMFPIDVSNYANISSIHNNIAGKKDSLKMKL